MSAWIMGIATAIVLTTLIDVILQEGETKKYVKGIASILVIAAIVVPIPKLMKSEFKWSFVDEQGTPANVTDSYLERVYREQYKTLELSIQTRLKNEGLDGVTVRINYNYVIGEIFLINVTADKAQLIITEEMSNININEKIITAVQKVVDIDKSKIIILG